MTKDSKYLLRQPSKKELEQLRRQHFSCWGGGLDVDQYLGREEFLASQVLTRNGGIAWWVLTSAEDEDTILASCESIKKEALVAYRSRQSGKPTVKDVISHGIGSVYTPEGQRKNGYASILLRYLGERLRTHGIREEEGSCTSDHTQESNSMSERPQEADGSHQDGHDEAEESPFSVLYSDIGKSFYAKLGWMPYHSSHISLPPLDRPTMPRTQALWPSSESPQSTKPFKWSNVMTLCEFDCDYIRQELENGPVPTGVEAKVAFLPTWEVIRWHHAREEYVGKFLRGKSPEIKGACTNDEKQWCIWTRTFAPHDRKLTILRFADWRYSRPLKGMVGYVNGSGRSCDEQGDKIASPGKNGGGEVDEGLVNLIQAARQEAHEWDLGEVVIWNPTKRILRAAEKAMGRKVEVVDREKDSIASLRWNVEECGAWSGDNVLWEHNEKFAWC